MLRLREYPQHRPPPIRAAQFQALPAFFFAALLLAFARVYVGAARALGGITLTGSGPAFLVTLLALFDVCTTAFAELCALGLSSRLLPASFAPLAHGLHAALRALTPPLYFAAAALCAWCRAIG